jgi:hypothetical protein
MGIGVKDLAALAATHPTIGHAELIRHDLEHRGTGWASGYQAHQRTIVES